MSRTEPRRRYPGSAFSTPLIQLSTPESVELQWNKDSIDQDVTLNFKSNVRVVEGKARAGTGKELCIRHANSPLANQSSASVNICNLAPALQLRFTSNLRSRNDVVTFRRESTTISPFGDYNMASFNPIAAGGNTTTAISNSTKERSIFNPIS
uniref:Uncharacterized protein n=1 Tax=Solanum tuberosum TaxID=4113 RepID=M1DGT2_SOLTU